METLHRSDAILTGLCSISTQTTASVVCDGKTKTYCNYSIPPVHDTEFLSIQRRTENKTAGVYLEGEQLIYGLGKETRQIVSIF